MNSTTSSSYSLHPLLWIAGISVILLSFAGIASLTGLLVPITASGALSAKSEPTTMQAVANASAPVVAPPESVTAPAAVVPKPAPVAAATQHKAAKKKVAADKPTSPFAMLPPPIDSGVPPDYVATSPVAVAPPIQPCANCGVIEGIRQFMHDGQGTGLGAIAGGVIGGALGSNLGKGNGRTLASIAAAIGGGMIGNRIEKSQHQTVGYQVSLRMENGTTRLIEMSTVPSWRIGDAVRLVDGAIVSAVL